MNQTSSTAWLNLGFIYESMGLQDQARAVYLAGQKQCKGDEFIMRINKKKKSEMKEVDDEELLQQVPETAAKEYIRTIPYIDGDSIGLPGINLDDIKIFPQSIFPE